MYPFGMQMPSRKYQSVTLSSAEGYRYGFNGKEKDKDINSLTAYDYGFRIYNPAIGKFLSTDPLTQTYPWFTPYQFAANVPTWAIDIDGLESNKNPNTNENPSTSDLQSRARALVKEIDKSIKRIDEDKKRLVKIDKELDGISKDLEGIKTQAKELSNKMVSIRSEVSTSGTRMVTLLNNKSELMKSNQQLMQPPSFTLNGNANLTVGAQLAFSPKVGGLGQLNLEANLLSTSLASGSAGYNPDGNTPGLFGASGNYIGKDGKVTFEQGLTGEFSIKQFSDFTVGASYKRTTESDGMGNETIKSQVDFQASAPVLKAPNEQDFKHKGWGVPSISPFSSKSTSGFTVSNVEKKFFGIDISGKIAAIFGIEGAFKLGFYYNGVKE